MAAELPKKKKKTGEKLMAAESGRLGMRVGSRHGPQSDLLAPHFQCVSIKIVYGVHYSDVTYDQVSGQTFDVNGHFYNNTRELNIGY